MSFKGLVGCILLMSVSANASELSKSQEDWLKKTFSDQHEKLLPVVAVADMFFACNQQRKTDDLDYQVKTLITKMDRNELAQKLRHCLQGELPTSDTALNFGLIGCFHEQLQHLPEDDRKIKQKLVRQAIAKLSKAERQKSFTQCVTDQAIGYLK